MKSFFATIVLAMLCTATSASDITPTVDIPVKLKTAKVVFNMDHLAFAGDKPVGIGYMHVLAEKMKADGTTGEIIAIFHGDAAYMTLSDESYNAHRGVTSGNPYKGLIGQLQNEGVKIEECVNSMKNNHWVNADLLPGVKVNGGAIARLVELEQQGFVQLQP